MYGVTRGQLPQRAGSLGLNGGGAAAAVPLCPAKTDCLGVSEFTVSLMMTCIILEVEVKLIMN